MTIKELREREVKRLHALKGCTNENAKETYCKTMWDALDTPIDECQKEKSLMTRFYRLSGLSDRLFELENSRAMEDGRSWAIRWCKDMEEQQERLTKKLAKDFQEYGITLKYNYWLPSLCVVHQGGGVSEVIQRWYY